MSWSVARLEAIAVFALIAAAFFPGLLRVPFHIDESHWIGLSAPFEAFVTGRFSDPIWQERQDKALTAPVTYYVIGAARRLGGFTPDRLNRPWRWFAPDEVNEAEGRVPEPDLLWWGRAGVTTTAVIALFLFYRLIRGAAGRPEACAWLALALVNPYLRDILRRAMNEGVLLCFLSLATWATSRALPHIDPQPGAREARRKAAAWLALAAVAAGLAAQTKLNGSFAVPGALTAVALVVARSALSWRERIVRLGVASAILVSVAAATFVAANPSLWPDPARETVRALRARAETTRFQAGLPDGRGLYGNPRHVPIVLTRVFADYALVPLGAAGPMFFVIGAAAAVAGLRSARPNRDLVSMVSVGGAVALPMLLTPLDRPRMYVLPVFYVGLLSSAGLVWAARRLRQRWRGART